MADGSEAAVLEEVDKVPITVEDLTYVLTFLVVNDAPFGLIIGRPAIKFMRASLDFDKNIAIFRSGKEVVAVPL